MDDRDDHDDQDYRDDRDEYGDCIGPDAMYIKLISSDGHEFVLKREQALMSSTIEAMLSGPGQFAENQTNEINFREIPSHILNKICLYLIYKSMYWELTEEFTEGLSEPFQDFQVEPQIALELMAAANFFDC